MSRDSAPGASVNPTTKFRSGLDLALYSVGAGQELVYAPQSGVRKVLTAHDAQLLQRLRAFATLDEHAASTCKHLGLAPHRVAQIREQLAALAEEHEGLLISHTSLLEHLAQASAEPHLPAEPIRSLTVPTRNRPDLLKRCLQSYAECARNHGHDIRLVVMDSSDDPAVAEANIATLRFIKKEFGNEILYLDGKSVQDSAARLAATSGLPIEIIEFALVNVENCPVDTGMNRNALMLATVGELALQVDDDTICRVARCPEPRHVLKLTSARLSSDWWFGTDDESLPNAQPDLDIFALHEQVLGHCVRDQIRSVRAEDIDLNQVGLTFLDRVRSDGGSVLVSSMGVTGDCTVGSPYFTYLRLDDQNRARLISSESAYRNTWRNRQILRCVTAPTICDRAAVSGNNMGLDNRRLLPPFTPVQRSQDMHFSSFIYSSGQGYSAHLPWALEHRGSQKHDTVESATQLLSGRIITLLLQKFTPMKHRTAEENLMALGRYLEDLGSQPLNDFEEIVKMAVWRLGLDRIRALEQLLGKHGKQPQFWASDLQQLIDATRVALPAAHNHLPADLIQVFGMEQARTLMQRLVLQLGKLLQVWPQVRQAAHELRIKGHTFGTEI